MANFNILATAVRQLGEELVSDEITALLELVKNCYDADADYANVIIDTTATTCPDLPGLYCPNGYIMIEDNGFGMNLDEIENGWLVISLSLKRKLKAEGNTTPRGRTPLGDKGLGRLSTQRLGNNLDMLTSKEGEAIKHYVSFSWKDFYEEELLTDVIVGLTEAPNPNRKKGTKLIISDLRDPNVWLGESKITIQNKLSQIISPFEKARPFKVYLTINGEPLELDKIVNTIREAALSQYSFEFDGKNIQINANIKLNKLKALGEAKNEIFNSLVEQDEGQELFIFLTEHAKVKLNSTDAKFAGKSGIFFNYTAKYSVESIPKLQRLPNDIASPGSFIGEIDEFALRGVEIGNFENIFDKAAEYREFVKNQVGIRIFRQGFGIRPYGYQGDDWLRLGYGTTSGRSFYGLRPSNVIGFVALDEHNFNLREKTDREGFLENAYSHNFFTLMYFIKDKINELLEIVRRGYNEYKDKREEEDLGFGTQTVQRSFALLAEGSQKALVLSDKIDTVQNDINAVTVSISEAYQDFSTDATIDDESQKKLALLFDKVDEILKKASSTLDSVKSLLPGFKKLENIAKVLKPRLEALESQLADFSELASLGLISESLSHELNNITQSLELRSRELSNKLKSRKEKDVTVLTYLEHTKTSISAIRKQISHLAPSMRYMRDQREIFSIKSLISELITFYKGRFEGGNINFKIVDSFNDFQIKVNRGKFTQILDNLILNAEYWLKEHKKSNPSFNPEINFRTTSNALIISDNGLGIDRNIEQNLFQPFITMKPRGEGRGLGLFIVQQLLDSSNCNITLLPERNEYGRRYSFAITLSSIII